MTADEIRTWREKTKADFGELINFMNAMIAQNNDALPGAVDAALTPRLADIERLRLLRAELGDDPEMPPPPPPRRTSRDW